MSYFGDQDDQIQRIDKYIIKMRPYRGDRSPMRDADQLYIQSNALRSQLSMLEEENAILKLKCVKVSELQDKVEMVLRQNSQLLSENEKMARLLHQHKLESDGLRNKADSLTAQKSAILTDFEMERKKLLQELDHMADAISDLQAKKNSQIGELKEAHQFEMQALKRQITQLESANEAEARKYREQIDKREHEINDLLSKVKRVSTEGDYEILRLKEENDRHQKEKERLKETLQRVNAEGDYEILKLKEENERHQKEKERLKETFQRATTERDYEMLKMKEESERHQKEKERLKETLQQERDRFKEGLQQEKGRFLEEKDKIRNEMASNQDEHIKDIEHLRAKLENSHLEMQEALKRAHLHALEEAEQENLRLRNGLQDKTREVDQLDRQLAKQKELFEDTIHFLQKDNEALRKRVVETEEVGNYQLQGLKNNLMALHEQQIGELMAKGELQTKVLEEELFKLQNLVQGKNAEIEQLIKDKNTNRSLFDSELGRVKDDYAAMLQKYRDLEDKLEETVRHSAARLNEREKHIVYLQDLLEQQKNNAHNDIQHLQKALETQRLELNSERMLFKEKEQALKEEAANLQRQLEQQQLTAEQKESSLQRNLEQLKSELEGTSTNLNSKAEGLGTKNRALEKENEALKNSLSLREREIKSQNDRIKSAAERAAKLQAEIDDLRQKLIQREQKSGDSINEQKNRLEASYSRALEALRSDHEAAMRLQASKIRDLQQKLRKKESELQQLLQMYRKMTEEWRTIAEQEANKREMTLKFPGATADLVASKNLFDVYLKTKVIDVCGDALKENRSKPQ